MIVFQFEFGGEQLTARRLRMAWEDLRVALCSLSVTSADSLFGYLLDGGYRCSSVGGYVGPEAQERLWNQVAIECVTNFGVN